MSTQPIVSNQITARAFEAQPAKRFAAKHHAADILRDIRVSIVAVVVAIAMVVTAALTGIDFVKLYVKLLENIEKYQVDDLLAGFILIFVGLTIDRVLSHVRKRRQAETQAQTLRTLHATMRTVNHIINNFLNNLLLFEMQVAEVMPESSTDLLDQLIQETHQKLKALGDLESVREKPFPTGMGIEYMESCPTPQRGQDDSSPAIYGQLNIHRA